MYFPMIVVEGVATRYGRASRSLDTAIRQALKSGARRALVRKYGQSEPVWVRD
jgi:hypothetical protein